jgi:hypothetical protein
MAISTVNISSWSEIFDGIFGYRSNHELKLLSENEKLLVDAAWEQRFLASHALSG